MNCKQNVSFIWYLAKHGLQWVLVKHAVMKVSLRNKTETVLENMKKKMEDNNEKKYQ